MNPCSECGGSGTTTETDSWGPNECSRCADMPWLPCPAEQPASVWKDWPDCGGRGRFRPDPDDVMRWCFTHDAYTPVPTTWQVAVCVNANFDQEERDCDFGWVARPQRLETVEVDGDE